jgi:hypothetical protein
MCFIYHHSVKLEEINVYLKSYKLVFSLDTYIYHIVTFLHTLTVEIKKKRTIIVRSALFSL